MKFCCFAFEMYYTLENQYCYNIRKVKLTSPRLTEHGMMKYYNIPSLRGTRHKRADICFVMTMAMIHLHLTHQRCSSRSAHFVV